MDAATVFRVISLIPDRTARAQSGCLFAEGGAAVSRFLNWLSPLNPIGKEEQQQLGLREPNARPVPAEEQEPEALDEAALDEAEDSAVEPEPPQAIQRPWV